MENASKALLMAAGILIGIMILSLAVYLIFSFGGTSAEIGKQKQLDQINQFNAPFLVYDQRKDLTIYDVVTLANLATENNQKKQLTSAEREKANVMYIAVKFEGKYLEYGSESIKLENYSKQILENINGLKIDTAELPQYTASVKLSKVTGMVYSVMITRTK